MTEMSDSSHIPPVEAVDVSTILYEDIIDSTHEKRYEHFANTNPILLREITKRAFTSAHNNMLISDISTLEAQKIIIDSVTFALRAIEVAIKRLAQPGTNDAVGDAGQLRSSEPGDDQPTD